MKRTHHLSSDVKTSVKQGKINLMKNKPVLQPLPKASSPVLSQNQRTLEESSKSPRIKRGVKSQINFLYSPKNDNLKYLVKEGTGKKINSIITEKGIGQNETPSQILDVFNSETCRSGKESSEMFLLNKEKNSLNKSSLEKKLLRVQLKDKSLAVQDPVLEEIKNQSLENFDELENEATVSEDPENLKKLISDKSCAYSKLEEMYCQDTNSLKREVEKLRMTIKRQDIEISSYRSRIDQNASDLEDLQKRLFSISKEKEGLISQYEDDLAIKKSEVLQMNEIINKLKLDRKNKDEQIKDLQRQVLVISNCNKIIENDLFSNKKELLIANETLQNTSKKLQLFDAQSQELSTIRSLQQDLEHQLKTSLKSFEFVSNNYKVLQTKYNDTKEELEEKNSQLSEALIKLSDSISSSKTPAKPALRRTSTLNLSTLTPETQKDNFSRLYQKISGLEEELQQEKFEKEKLSRNFEYSKKIIDEKLQIISKLESKVQSDYLMQVEVIKESLASQIFEHLNIFQRLLNEVKNSVTCSKCRSPEGKFISWDCEHIFCKTCAMFQETCPCCSSGSRVLRPKLLKMIYSKLPEQQVELDNVKKLFQGKSNNN
jgi:hypothetical protein